MAITGLLRAEGHLDPIRPCHSKPNNEQLKCGIFVCCLCFQEWLRKATCVCNKSIPRHFTSRPKLSNTCSARILQIKCLHLTTSALRNLICGGHALQILCPGLDASVIGRFHYARRTWTIAKMLTVQMLMLGVTDKTSSQSSTLTGNLFSNSGYWDQGCQEKKNIDG